MAGPYRLNAVSIDGTPFVTKSLAWEPRGLRSSVSCMEARAEEYIVERQMAAGHDRMTSVGSTRIVKIVMGAAKRNAIVMTGREIGGQRSCSLDVDAVSGAW